MDTTLSHSAAVTNRPLFTPLPKLKPGDTISVVSPAADLAAKFPHIFDLGLKRLREVFGLNIKEYPATRKVSPSPRERADDVMAAFLDPETRAVFSAIGGCDQIRILPFLSEEEILKHPKPYFGFSDNTNLHLFLWRLGIPSYYGGAVMMQYAQPEGVNKITDEFSRCAFFNAGPRRVRFSDMFNEVDSDWSNRDFENVKKEYSPSPAVCWEGSGLAKGVLWGGCLELISTHLMVNKWLCEASRYDKTILALETSEDIPSLFHCWDTVMALGERGILQRLSGLIVGRPKAWFYDRRMTPEERQKYRDSQRAEILKAFRMYNSDAPAVFNLDFGHTEPQIILPFGRMCTINADEKWIELDY